MAGTAIRRIALAQPWIGDRERELVEQVLASGILALGPFARAFEESVASVAGRRFGVACSSGTAGLHMVDPGARDRRRRRGHHDAVQLRRVGELPPVRTSPASFRRHRGRLARPRPEPGRGCAGATNEGDPSRSTSSAGHAGSRRSRRIADTRGWAARRGRLRGARVAPWRPADGLVRRGVGVRVLPEQADHDRRRRCRRHRRPGARLDLPKPAQPGTRRGRHVASARPARLQLPASTSCPPRSASPNSSGATTLVAGRARVAAAYEAALGGYDWVRLPQAAADETVDWFVYVVRLDPAVDRDAVIGRLDARGVASRPYFSPLHLQPFYRPGIRASPR